jgi:ubiquitin-protein ligase
MTQFFTVEEYDQVNLTPLEDAIFKWKIKNIVTYMDNINYISEDKIEFRINISDDIYNFMLTNDDKKWQMTFIDVIDTDNKIHTKIIEMVKHIDSKYITSEHFEFTNICDIIEKTVDEYDFGGSSSDDIDDEPNVIFQNDDDEDEDEDEDENEDAHSVNDYDPFVNIDDELEKFDSIPTKNMITEHDYFDDHNPDHFDDNVITHNNNIDTEINIGETDFKEYVDGIVNNINDVNDIDYCLLKSNAHVLIEKLKKDNNVDEHDNKMFEPEQAINIIIHEIKQLHDMDDVTLDLSENNIYNFNVIYKSEMFNKNIIMQITLDTMSYPSSPPTINLIKPLMTYNINYLVNTMDYFQLCNWNMTNSLQTMFTDLIKLIEKYGKISENRESYSELSNMITKLSIICKMTPKIQTDDGKLISFQLPFVKTVYNNDTSTHCTKDNKWKSGTGYGFDGASSWNIKQFLESANYKNGQIASMINRIDSNITNTIKDPSINQFLIDDIVNSCLVEFIVTQLTDNFDVALSDFGDKSVDQLIHVSEILFDKDPTIFKNYYDKFKNNFDCVKKIKKITKESSTIDNIIKLYEKFMAYKIDDKLIINQIDDNQSDDVRKKYLEIMKPFQFDLCSNFTNICHVGGKLINSSRVIKESSVLSKSLPFDYESSIYVRFDESNMQSIKAIIIPSHDTPYSNGCFLFHIYLNADYPRSPPHVKLLTTGHGTVRFNPNLYTDGKVCLSLLGTWEGAASEKWNESSTILQLLISIQSLIFIEQPYFNEPSHENYINSEKGKSASDEYNKNIQAQTMCWAMVDMIKNPPEHFEDVIINHFKLKKDHILKETKTWVENSSNKYNTVLKNKYDELNKLLNNL